MPNSTAHGPSCASNATAPPRPRRIAKRDWSCCAITSSELKALDLKTGEIEELTAERQRLSQHGRLASGAREILQLLRETEDMNAEHAVSRALTVSRSLSELDARFASIAKAIDESLIALREGIESAERYEADLEADPQRQEWVEQRLAAIESIARKHRVEPAALGTLQAELAAEFQQLDTLEASLEQIEKKLGRSCRRNFAPRASSSAPRASRPQARCRGESAS